MKIEYDTLQLTLDKDELTAIYEGLQARINLRIHQTCHLVGGDTEAQVTQWINTQFSCELRMLRQLAPMIDRDYGETIHVIARGKLAEHADKHANSTPLPVRVSAVTPGGILVNGYLIGSVDHQPDIMLVSRTRRCLDGAPVRVVRSTVKPYRRP